MRAGWMRPSVSSRSSVSRAISRRTPSKPDSSTAPGVSSMMKSIPVSVSSDADVAALAADDPALQLVRLQLHDRHGGLDRVARRHPLHHGGEDAASAPVGVLARLLLHLPDDAGALVAQIVLELAHHDLLRLPGAQAGHALELPQLPRLLGLQLLARVVEVAPPVLQRALALVELMRLQLERGLLCAQPLLQPRQLGPAGEQLLLEVVAPSRRAGLRGRRRRGLRASQRLQPDPPGRSAGAVRASPPQPRHPPRPAPPTRSPSPSPHTAHAAPTQHSVSLSGAARRPRDSRHRLGARHAPSRARAVQRLGTLPNAPLGLVAVGGQNRVQVRHKIGRNARLLVSRRTRRPRSHETTSYRGGLATGGSGLCGAATLSRRPLERPDRVVGDLRRVAAAHQHLPSAVPFAIVLRCGRVALLQQQDGGLQL